MGKVATDRTIKFVSKYGKEIAQAIVGTGLYFEAVVGQKCGESGYGDSELAKLHNNFGGIRYTSNMPPSVGFVMYKGYGDKTEKKYASFKRAKDCFDFYVQTILSPQKKYVSFGVLKATSPEEQIIKMVQAGYCEGVTPKDYLANCQGAIDAARNVYKLGKIDNISTVKI